LLIFGGCFRSQEEADAFNEKAVAADPEEVVSMVEMCVTFSTLSLMF
jgi:pectate lyase